MNFQLLDPRNPENEGHSLKLGGVVSFKSEGTVEMEGWFRMTIT